MTIIIIMMMIPLHDCLLYSLLVWARSSKPTTHYSTAVHCSLHYPSYVGEESWVRWSQEIILFHIYMYSIRWQISLSSPALDKNSYNCPLSSCCWEFHFDRSLFQSAMDYNSLIVHAWCCKCREVCIASQGISQISSLLRPATCAHCHTDSLLCQVVAWLNCKRLNFRLLALMFIHNLLVPLSSWIA